VARRVTFTLSGFLNLSSITGDFSPFFFLREVLFFPRRSPCFQTPGLKVERAMVSRHAHAAAVRSKSSSFTNLPSSGKQVLSPALEHGGLF